jgi:chitinase
MIGVNDTPGETFTLANAQSVLNFADATGYVSRLSMWSLARDDGSCAGTT